MTVNEIQICYLLHQTCVCESTDTCNLGFMNIHNHGLKLQQLYTHVRALYQPTMLCLESRNVSSEVFLVFPPFRVYIIFNSRAFVQEKEGWDGGYLRHRSKVQSPS